MVVRVDEHEFGIVVDGLRTEGGRSMVAAAAEVASLTTVVVKPIGSLLAQAGIYAGASVLGDGRVVLILDLRGLLRAADLPPVKQPAEGSAAGASTATARGDDRYLVCRTATGRRIAMPLAWVRRLENVPAGALESVGARRVVRRGDAFTPVVDADGLLGAPAAAPDDTVRLVVVGDDDKSVGLAVQQILDVESADTPLQPALASCGVVGSLSLGGIATEVLDLDSARAAGRA